MAKKGLIQLMKSNVKTLINSKKNTTAYLRIIKWRGTGAISIRCVGNAFLARPRCKRGRCSSLLRLLSTLFTHPLIHSFTHFLTCPKITIDQNEQPRYTKPGAKGPVEPFRRPECRTSPFQKRRAGNRVY